MYKNHENFETSFQKQHKLLINYMWQWRNITRVSAVSDRKRLIISVLFVRYFFNLSLTIDNISKLEIFITEPLNIK